MRAAFCQDCGRIVPVDSGVCPICHRNSGLRNERLLKNDSADAQRLRSEFESKHPQPQEWECSNCSATVTPADKYCHGCGVLLEFDPDPNEPARLWKCPKCKASVTEGDKYCAACGTGPITYGAKKTGPIAKPKTSSNSRVVDKPEHIYTRTEKKPGNAMALTGVALGIASVFLSFIGIVPILAIVFSGIGLSRAASRDGAGRGQAWTGLVLGILFTLVYLYQYYGHLG